MNNYEYALHSKTDDRKLKNRERLYQLFQDRPMPDHHLLTNMGLFIRSSALAKFFFLDEMYRHILDIPGKIFVFGMWWGQDIVVLENLRAMHEPYNHARQIVGFDTFAGYPSEDIGEKDVNSLIIKGGGYRVSEDYLTYLNELIEYHENENIMHNIKKVELVKGNVIETVPQYFERAPETICAMAYFDLALYEPTKVALEHIKNSCIKGSIIILDELNDKDYPGETIAVKELFDLNKTTIKRSKILPDRSYLIFE